MNATSSGSFFGLHQFIVVFAGGLLVSSMTAAAGEILPDRIPSPDIPGAGIRGTLKAPAALPLLINSWTTSANGFWEDDHWSLGVLPSLTQGLICLTNAGSKEITIRPQTAAEHPASLMLSNLLILGPTTATNVLLVEQGLEVPLWVDSTLETRTNGHLRVREGSLIVGETMRVTGKAEQAGNSETRFGVVELGPGGEFTLRGGAVFCSTLGIGEEGTFYQEGGTNVVDGEITFLGNGSYELAGGRLRSENVTMGFGWPMFRQTGGEHVMAGKLSIIFGGYSLLGGSLSASNISLYYGSLNLEGGSVTNTGMFSLVIGSFSPNGRDCNLGRLHVEAAECQISMHGGPATVRFLPSSEVRWGESSLLFIDSWTGSANGGGEHRIFCGTNEAGLNQRQLDRIFFRNPAGFTNGLYLARILPTGEIVPGSLPKLRFNQAGNHWVFSWPDGFTLLTATNINGPWDEMLDMAGPFTNNLPSLPQRYFRVWRFYPIPAPGTEQGRY